MIVSTLVRFGGRSGRDAWNEHLDDQALEEQQKADAKRAAEEGAGDNKDELTSAEEGKLYSDGCTFSSYRRSFIA